MRVLVRYSYCKTGRVTGHRPMSTLNGGQGTTTIIAWSLEFLLHQRYVRERSMHVQAKQTCGHDKCTPRVISVNVGVVGVVDLVGVDDCVDVVV